MAPRLVVRTGFVLGIVLLTALQAGAGEEDTADEGARSSASRPSHADEAEPPREATSDAGSVASETELSEEERAERAREEFRAGQQAFADGKFTQAAQHFQRANDAHPHAAVLFNMARAWHQAEELERAADAFAAAIKRGELEYEQANKAQQTLERLRARLGWAKLSGASSIRVNLGYREDEALPLQTHLAPGQHAINATAENGETWTQMVTISADQPHSVVVARPKEEPKVVPVVAPPPPVVDTGKRRRQMTWGYLTLGTGAALGAASAVLGSAALSSKDKYEATDPLDPELYSQTKSLRTWTNVAAFGGLIVGGTSVVLLLTLPKEDESPDVGVALGPQSVTMVGRF